MSEDFVDATTAFNWFKENSTFTTAQICGILGNIQQESSFDYTSDTGDSGKAYGLCQWEGVRITTFDQLYGYSIYQSTFTEQLQFIKDEMSLDYPQAETDLLATTTPADAAAVICNEYEKPNVATENLAGREQYAGDFYNYFTASSSPPAYSDLTPEDFSLSSMNVAPGGSLTVDWTIVNQGAGVAAASETELRITPNPPPATGAPSNDLRAIDTPQLGAGTSDPEDATVTVPTQPGTYLHKHFVQR